MNTYAIIASVVLVIITFITGIDIGEKLEQNAQMRHVEAVNEQNAFRAAQGNQKVAAGDQQIEVLRQHPPEIIHETVSCPVSPSARRMLARR